jgi:hypothetical protein
MTMLHSDVIKTLEWMADSFTPRIACNSLVGFSLYEQKFFAIAIPQAMKQAGVIPNWRLWDNELTKDALAYVLKQKAREDIVFGASNVPVERVDDEDIYDGAGGYAHNSDDGSEFNEEDYKQWEAETYSEDDEEIDEIAEEIRRANAQYDRRHPDTEIVDGEGTYDSDPEFDFDSDKE